MRGRRVGEAGERQELESKKVRSGRAWGTSEQEEQKSRDEEREELKSMRN